MLNKSFSHFLNGPQLPAIALNLLFSSALCITVTGCIPDELAPYLQWLPGQSPTAKPAEATDASAQSTEKTDEAHDSSVALPPEIPQPGMPAITEDSVDDIALLPDPVLVDTTIGEATALGLENSATLADESFQQQAITKATFAQWLTAWVEPQKPLPNLPEADLSPYADVDGNHPQLDALRLTTTQHWLPVAKSVNGSPVYMHPTEPVTLEQVFRSTLLVQGWLNNATTPPPGSLPPLYTEAKDTGLTETLFGQPLDEATFNAQLAKPATQLQALMVMAFWL